MGDHNQCKWCGRLDKGDQGDYDHEKDCYRRETEVKQPRVSDGQNAQDIKVYQLSTGRRHIGHIPLPRGLDYALDLRDARAERDAALAKIEFMENGCNAANRLIVAQKARLDAALEALRLTWILENENLEHLESSDYALLDDWRFHTAGTLLGFVTKPFDGDATAAQALVEKVLKEVK